MALTIEDGTVVAGADSWITEAEWITHLSDLGRTVTTSTAENEITLRKAQRALSQRLRYKGTPVNAAQTTVLPREWGDTALYNGFTVANTDIPQAFKDAQAELAWSIHNGADPFVDTSAMTAGTGPLIKRVVTAGPVKTEYGYADTSDDTTFDATDMRNYTIVMDLLNVYLKINSFQVSRS